jgi:hypothetical protein
LIRCTIGSVSRSYTDPWFWAPAPGPVDFVVVGLGLFCGSSGDPGLFGNDSLEPPRTSGEGPPTTGLPYGFDCDPVAPRWSGGAATYDVSVFMPGAFGIVFGFNAASIR